MQTKTVAPTLTHLAVPISSLRPHPRNPRRGDLEAVKDSLRHHGQYRPVVANCRTGEVLAGNRCRGSNNAALQRPQSVP